MRVKRLHGPLACLLGVAAIGLGACGGSATKKPPAVGQTVTPTTTSATSTTANLKSSKLVSARARRNATGRNATGRNATAIDPANAYRTIPGPQPLDCLRSSPGLNRARKAKEFGVWEANAGTTASNDSNGKVFVDGPYRTVNAARAAAQSLQGVEFAASAGRWEVSASLRSRLEPAVSVVANCMAGGDSAKSTGNTP